MKLFIIILFNQIILLSTYTVPVSTDFSESKMFNHIVDSYPEINKPISAKYLKCFGYPSFKERVPRILQGVINDLKNDNQIKSQFGENAVKEIDTVVKKIETFITEIISDQPLNELNTDGAFAKDAALYNKEIKLREIENAGIPPSWFQTEWLFAECYCYFKLHDIFYISAYLKEYDPFLKLKNDALLSSKAPVLHLSKFIINNTRISKDLSEEEKKATLIFLLKCSLWGNKADLSLSGGKLVSTNENVTSEMDSLDSNILTNDLEETYDLLNAEKSQTIGIILDNAGYELFNDLCFADYLVKAGFAKKVIFHGKAIPWFVSDVTQLDFDLMFDSLPKLKSEHVESLVRDWSNYLQNDKWAFKAESFWTTPYDYSKMSIVDPELYGTLAQYKLVIFKGDLNYRKLVGDIYWEPTTSFKTALRGFEPTNVLALRTVKADPVAGLKKGLFEELFKKDPNWFSTGEYALVQLLKKK